MLVCWSVEACRQRIWGTEPLMIELDAWAAWPSFEVNLLLPTCSAALFVCIKSAANGPSCTAQSL